MGERREDTERMVRELHELEDRAGIRRQTERAYEGSLVPLGIMGDPATPAEYFADEYDYTRRGIRKAYFGVADIELRKSMIKLRRRIDARLNKTQEQALEDAEQALQAARLRANEQPWGAAALVAGIAVGVGYLLAGTAGSLAGAVVGYFLGHGVIHSAKRDAAEAQDQAQQRVNMERKALAEERATPAYFDLSEELSGEEHRAFSHESAFANLSPEQRSPPD